MIGSFITRGLVMVFGYAYPAYECYKTVEMNKPEIEQLRFWCQYWILVAVLTVLERVGDTFISWVPMYSEAKLAFFIYLWYPKTKGTTYVYDSFFRPYIAKHETEIDRNLSELRTRAGDMAVLYWQRAASYGQTRIFDILQYVAAQSTSNPGPAQAQQGPRSQAARPTAPNHQPPTLNRQRSAPQPVTREEPPSPTSSASSSQQKKEVAEDTGTSKVPVPAAPAALFDAPNENTAPETSTHPAPTKTEAMQIEAASSSSMNEDANFPPKAMQIEAASSSSTNEDANVPPKEIVMEETGVIARVTRARFRKTKSGNS